MNGDQLNRDPPTTQESEQCSDDIARRNIALVERMEQDNNSRRNSGDVFAEKVMRVCGSMPFVWVHVVWFAAWITINALPGLPHWDPFPFSFLTLTVSLEAIFLTIFILIAQNRQGELADQRNKLDLQINLLAEQESSKTIAMLEAIMEKLGIDTDDPEIAAFATPTHPERVLAHIKALTENGAGNGDGEGELEPVGEMVESGCGPR